MLRMDAFLHGLDGWMIVCTVKNDGKFSKDHVRSHVLLKVLSYENRGGSKLISIDPFMMNSLAGNRPFRAPNGHHHERSINVFSVFSTFNGFLIRIAHLA